MLKIGDTLPNGATVLEFVEPTALPSNPGYVLAKTHNGYASWAYHYEENGDIHTYWGHYTTIHGTIGDGQHLSYLAEALSNMMVRAGEKPETKAG